MDNIEDNSKEGVSVGGVGCFWILLGLAIFLNFPKILDIVEQLVR